MCFATETANLAISVAKLRKSPFCVLTYGIFSECRGTLFRVQGKKFSSAGEKFFKTNAQIARSFANFLCFQA